MSSIDTSADLTALFRQMKYELPEERMQGNIGNIMKEIESRMQSKPRFFFHQPLEDFDRLITLDKDMWNFKKILGDMTGADSTEAMLRRVRVDVESKYKKMSEQLRLFEEIKHGKMTKEQITASVKSFHQQEREKMIPETLTGMATLVLFQCAEMYLAWNRVSEAINVKKDPYEFTRINQEVEKIAGKVTEFCDVQWQRSQNIRSVFRKLRWINNLYRSTMSKISSLKVEMNGEIQCLGLQRDQSFQEGIANFGRAATQAQRLWENWSDMHPLMKGFQGVCAVFYVWLTYKGYQRYRLSQDALEGLRNKFLEVNRQQDKLQDLLDKAEEAYEEMEDEMP